MDQRPGAAGQRRQRRELTRFRTFVPPDMPYSLRTFKDLANEDFER
jgi:hypothetical protein